jgi:hypothetical protein
MTLIWRHVIVNTHGSWLHGDPRGFRSRDHRIHSSGDYRNPPPKGEHQLLYEFQKARCPEPVVIAPELRPVIARAFSDAMRDAGWETAIVSVSATHLHALSKLPEDRSETKVAVGDAKRLASRSVKRQMPGSVWSAGGTYKPVVTAAHYREAFEYIRTGQEEGAYVLVLASGAMT